MKGHCERSPCRDDATQIATASGRAIPAKALSGSFGRDFTRIPAAGKLGSAQREDEPLIPIGGGDDKAKKAKAPAKGAAAATVKGAAAKVTAPKLSRSTVSGPTANDCGGLKWVVQWKLDKKTTVGGWVVQKVNYTPAITKCDGKAYKYDAADDFWDPSWSPYWEAWQINKDQDVTTYAETGDKEDDTFESGGKDDTKGKYKIQGTAQFYEGLALPADFKVTNAAPAWILPTTKSAPTLKGGTGSIDHSIGASWNCCKDSKSKKTVTS